MVVKFLKASGSFKGVFYNTDKISQGKAELMAAANFDALQGLSEIRPMDYVNYLNAVTARNKGVSEPQLHVAISTACQSHDKNQLTKIAVAWMEKMGYGKQPYLIVFHKDTENNHVHIVSTRIDHEGRKISSDFERVRAVKVLNQVMGVDEERTVQKDIEKARSYRCSTVAQFKLILENMSYTIRDNELIKFGKKLAEIDFAKVELRNPDLTRAAQLKAIFKKYAPRYDTAGFTDYIKTKMGVELIFHAKDGKPAYGYTIIDHAQKNAFKGSEIMPLKELLAHSTQQHLQISQKTTEDTKQSSLQIHYESQKSSDGFKFSAQEFEPMSPKETNEQISINISRDVDDESIHGPRRHRKKKARTNHR